ncbi:MAG: hypothetical protein A3G97_08735 [Candidatus Rokubacteria bacterium RIFCSPLOWO2_12_FULL_69_21]|nr:MAG: hypothetical protein A3G97_08735 [Candidatus Rokubacteria bacterium RIFCSPLOWO2_12_FULL_69_21]
MGRWVALAWLGFALALSLGVPSAAVAADWGAISPGASTIETVRERYGAPSRETRQKLEGYDTIQWVYEGARAPAGMKRMIVEFGLLAPSGYRANLVRSFTLEPKPRIFDYVTIVRGWGIPDGIAEREGRKVYFYQRGLLVYFDQSGDDTVSMVFSPPQPEPKPAAK